MYVSERRNSLRAAFRLRSSIDYRLSHFPHSNIKYLPGQDSWKSSGMLSQQWQCSNLPRRCKLQCWPAPLHKLYRHKGDGVCSVHHASSWPYIGVNCPIVCSKTEFHALLAHIIYITCLAVIIYRPTQRTLGVQPATWDTHLYWNELFGIPLLHTATRLTTYYHVALIRRNVGGPAPVTFDLCH